MGSLPLIARSPLQSPLAVQDEASPVVSQDSCTVSPWLIVVLFAANETTTASGALTVMLTPSLTIPPGPSQVMWNEVESVNGPTVVAPVNANSPDHAPPA